MSFVSDLLKPAVTETVGEVVDIFDRILVTPQDRLNDKQKRELLEHELNQLVAAGLLERIKYADAKVQRQFDIKDRMIENAEFREAQLTSRFQIAQKSESRLTRNIHSGLAIFLNLVVLVIFVASYFDSMPHPFVTTFYVISAGAANLFYFLAKNKKIGDKLPDDIADELTH